MKELPLDFVDALLSEPVHSIKQQIDHICSCGARLEMGYCPNCDPVVEVKDCDWCGCCPDPAHCVWSVTCPICSAEPREGCIEGNKLVGLHKERWDESNRQT